jgi:hypothetical protein
MVLKGGARIEYTGTSPTVYITAQPDIEVEISPRHKQIKSGDPVTFTTRVSGASGQVTYNWDFGDGKSATTSKGTVTHSFNGSEKTFNVVVTVSSTVNPRTDNDLAIVTAGKVKKEKKKKQKRQEDDLAEPDDNGSYDPGYVPGYNDDYYDDGTGTGAGTREIGSPSAPSPSQQRQKKQQKKPQPADDGLETVSGELIGPGSTATVIPSTDSPATGTEEASPVDDGKGGGGLPGGVKAAIGVGALLGLGGLAEAGAFTGTFRRIRLRP